MALHLYRRHRRDCKGVHPEDSRSGEFDERKKGWKPCACPIVVSRTLDGQFKRKPTDHTEWQPAHAVAATWEAPGIWNALAPQVSNKQLTAFAETRGYVMLDQFTAAAAASIGVQF